MYTKDWVAKWALYSPQQVALKELDTDRAYTYAELNQAANHLATELTQTHGLQKGDRLMVLAEHCLEYVALFVAAQKTGLVLVPINYRLACGEIDYLVRNCEPALLIYEAQFQDKALALPGLAAVPQVWPLQTLTDLCQRGLATPHSLT